MEEVKYIQGDLVKLNGKTVKITFAGRDVIEYIPLMMFIAFQLRKSVMTGETP